MREIEKADSDVSDELKKPGVYIWGFLYKRRASPKKAKKTKLCIETCLEKDNWEIVNCNEGKKYKNELKKAYTEIQSASKNNKECTNYLFVPYYVGISTDKNNGVKVRLNKHRELDEDTSKNQDIASKKYVRLKDDFMLCYHKHVFFLDEQNEPTLTLPKFPILKGTLNNNHVWTLLAAQGYVYHFNRQSICRLVTHFDQETKQKLLFQRPFRQKKENDNYSISDYSDDFGNNDWIIQKDPLKNRVKKDGDNNFWFTYCEIEDSSLIDYIKTKLIDVESKKDMNKSKLDELKDKKVKNESKLTELREKIRLIKEKPEKTNARLEKDDLENENRTLNKDIQNLQKQDKNLNKQSEILQKDEGELKKKDEEDDKEKVRKKYFHQAEAATYFALRGITFSRTHTVEFPEGWGIQNNSGFNIFLDSAANKKKKNVITCTPEDEFNWPGYW